MPDISDYALDYIDSDPTTRALLRGLKNLVTRGGFIGTPSTTSYINVQATTGLSLPLVSQPPVAITRGVGASGAIGAAGPVSKSGYEKPVGAALRLRLSRLRREIKNASPQGKARPSGYRVGNKFYTYRKAYTPGKLKSSWDNPNTVQLNRTGKSILVRNDLPYARAQDKGANIPERRAKPGKFLMFPGGGKFFHKKAKGFRLRGQHYIKQGVENWRRKWNYEENVRWAPYRGLKVTA